MLLRAHRSMRRPITSLRAEARIEQKGPRGRGRADAFLFVRRPESVRIDLMSPFGPLATLTSDGRQFALFDRRRSAFSEGPSCPSNIARLLGVGLSGREVVDMLLAEPLRLKGQAVLAHCGPFAYRVQRESEDGRRVELDFSIRRRDRDAPWSQQYLRLRRAAGFAATGQALWRLSYDDYRVVPDPRGPKRGGRRLGVAMPFQVRYADLRRGITLALTFRSMSLNVEVPARAFVQSAPPGVRRRRMQCLPGERLMPRRSSARVEAR